MPSKGRVLADDDNICALQYRCDSTTIVVRSIAIKAIEFFVAYIWLSHTSTMTALLRCVLTARVNWLSNDIKIIDIGWPWRVITHYGVLAQAWRIAEVWLSAWYARYQLTMQAYLKDRFTSDWVRYCAAQTRSSTKAVGCLASERK